MNARRIYGGNEADVSLMESNNIYSRFDDC